MNRECFADYGLRVVSADEYKVGRRMIRPKGVFPIKKDDAIELTDLYAGSDSFCKECIEPTQLIPKGHRSTIKNADIIDGEPRLVVLYQHRWFAQCCGAEHTIWTPYDANRCATEEFDRYVIKEILDDPTKTYKQYAICGVSEPYVRKTVNNYLKDSRERIKSVCECSKIVFYPFEYGGQVRCCVYGERLPIQKIESAEETQESDTVLLYILDDHKAESIIAFLEEKSSFFSRDGSCFL